MTMTIDDKLQEVLREEADLESQISDFRLKGKHIKAKISDLKQGKSRLEQSQELVQEKQVAVQEIRTNLTSLKPSILADVSLEKAELADISKLPMGDNRNSLVRIWAKGVNPYFDLYEWKDGRNPVFSVTIPWLEFDDEFFLTFHKLVCILGDGEPVEFVLSNPSAQLATRLAYIVVSGEFYEMGICDSPYPRNELSPQPLKRLLDFISYRHNYQY